MTGFGAKVRRDRDESPDSPPSAAAIAETVARLKAALSAERLDELMQIGSAMAAADVLNMAIPE